MKITPKLKQKLENVNFVLTDVDGVLTDGGMYYSENGEMLKKFNTKDGMGVELLLLNKIKTILITKENSKIALSRGNKIKVALTIIDCHDKELELPKICKKFKIKPNQIAYVGDDINDFGIMKKVSVSFSPSDAHESIKKSVDYVCKSKGGEGVFREVADIIIQSKSSKLKKTGLLE
jgi:YrbI family 3-deoxy-D-manno-octulosonate 8-phosphate phosphatase